MLISVLLAPVAGSPPVSLYGRALSGDIALVISEITFAELRERTRNKPYLANRISPAAVDDLESTIRGVATIIPAPHDPPPAATRDPKDDYLLAPEILSMVDHIVTGDGDLLSVKDFGEDRTLSPAAFLQLLDEAQTP